MKCRVTNNEQVYEFEARRGATDVEIRYIGWGHLYQNQHSYDLDDESVVEKLVRGKWVVIW